MSLPASLYDCNPSQLGPYLRARYDWDDAGALDYLEKGGFSGKTLFLAISKHRKLIFCDATNILIKYILSKEPKKELPPFSPVAKASPEVEPATTQTEPKEKAPSDAAPVTPAKWRIVLPKDIAPVLQPMNIPLLNGLLEQNKTAECTLYLNQFFKHLLNEVRTGQRIPCPFQKCGINGTVGIIKDHVARIHLPVRYFSCVYCHKDCNSKPSLINHFGAHLRDSEGNHYPSALQSPHKFPFSPKDLEWPSSKPKTESEADSVEETDFGYSSNDDGEVATRPAKKPKLADLFP